MNDVGAWGTRGPDNQKTTVKADLAGQVPGGGSTCQGGWSATTLNECSGATPRAGRRSQVKKKLYFLIQEMCDGLHWEVAQFILMRWQIVRNSTSLLLPQLLSELPSLSSKALSLQKLGSLMSVSSVGRWHIIITQLLYSALCILEVDLFLHFKLPFGILSWPQGQVKQASCGSVTAPCKWLSAPAHLHVHLLLWSPSPAWSASPPALCRLLKGRQVAFYSWALGQKTGSYQGQN